MTNLIGDLRSIMGTPFGGVGHAVLIFSRVTRAAFDSDSVILQLHDRIEMPEDAQGKFRVDNLDPGPIRVELEGGTVHNHGWNIDLPDEGTWSLADLVDAQVDWSPAVIGRAEAAARASRDHADRAESAADRIGTAEQVGAWAGEASGAADAAAQSESNAKQSELAASGYADTADGHASRAESAADTAAGETVTQVRSEFEGMLSGAEAARDAAGVSEANAAQSEAGASGFADLAEQYKTAAELAKDDAAQSKADAALSASSADTDAGAAAASASSAAQSESSAAIHVQSALGYAGQSEAARDESRIARDEAVQAAGNAQQGAPADGWKKSELSQPVQDSLSRADTALQSIPAATESAPGAIRLTGDLGGTANAPTVPRLEDKSDKGHTHAWDTLTGRPNIPVTDDGYRTRNADSLPTDYPPGVSLSMNSGNQGWASAISASGDRYGTGNIFLFLTMRNPIYSKSVTQLAFSYDFTDRPVYVRKWDSDSSGWSVFRRLTDDGHTHSLSQVTGLDGELQSLRDLIHARHAFFSGVGAPVDVPNAVAGDYYFDTESGELHKITGV